MLGFLQRVLREGITVNDREKMPFTSGVPSPPPIPLKILPDSNEGRLEFERSPALDSTLKGALVSVTLGLVLLVVFFFLLSQFWFVGVGILIVALALLVIKRRIDYYGRV